MKSPNQKIDESIFFAYSCKKMRLIAIELSLKITWLPLQCPNYWYWPFKYSWFLSCKFSKDLGINIWTFKSYDIKWYELPEWKRLKDRESWWRQMRVWWALWSYASAISAQSSLFYSERWLRSCLWMAIYEIDKENQIETGYQAW